MKKLLPVVLCIALEGHAQTWLATPDSANWGDAANWAPAQVPNGFVETSFATSATTTITVNGSFAVNSAEFSGDDFAFEIGTGDSLLFAGAGVVNTATAVPTFRVTGGALYFFNSALAGISDIELDEGAIFFNNDSGADAAAITATNGATVNFSGNASADDAFIINETGGVTAFIDLSSACCSLIFNRDGSQTTFNNSSTAHGADIWNDEGVTVFTDTSTAHEAWIQNSSGGNTLFLENASADQALLLNETGGYTSFTDNATAGTAIITNTGAATTFSGDATANGSTIMADTGSYVEFSGNSTADAATITTDTTSTLHFVENSSAGTAQIAADGSIFFANTANAANATIEANGLLDITGNTSGSVEIGSLSGATIFSLGENDLLLGSMEWDAGGAMLFELGLDPGVIAITGAFERGEDGTFLFEFSLGEGAAPGFYTLVTFGSTTFSEEDFSFVGPGDFDGHFVMNGSSLGFQLTTVPEPADFAVVGVLIGAAYLRRRRKSDR